MGRYSLLKEPKRRLEKKKKINNVLKVPESKWRCKVSEKALGGEGGDSNFLLEIIILMIFVKESMTLTMI